MVIDIWAQANPSTEQVNISFSNSNSGAIKSDYGEANSNHRVYNSWLVGYRNYFDEGVGVRGFSSMDSRQQVSYFVYLNVVYYDYFLIFLIARSTGQ